MAKGGNTWCKLLMAKAKANAMKDKLGNERGVMSYCQRAKPVTARALNRDTDADKPLPKGVNNKARSEIPRVAGWKPEPFVRVRQVRYWEVR